MGRNNILFPHLSKVSDAELYLEKEFVLGSILATFKAIRLVIPGNTTISISRRKYDEDLTESLDYYDAILTEIEYRKIP